MIPLPDDEDIFGQEEFVQEVEEEYQVPDILNHDVVSYDSQISISNSSSLETPLQQQQQQQQQQGSTIEKSREVLMSDIEKTIEHIVTSILVGEPIKLPIHARKLTTSTQQKKRKEIAGSSSTQQILYNTHETDPENNIRYLSLSSAKTLARYVSILQMIYEAIAYKFIVTKRDMYYRDVPLFGTQSVVDIIVDDISCHFNVPRSSLNVSAASKGLVFGPILIKLKSNNTLDCMGLQSSSNHSRDSQCNDEQGCLIPPISQVIEVQCKAKCMIVIEKEATFRYLVSTGFCQSFPQGCILVTGKGYPDLSTRQFVKYFSTHFYQKPIFALMDGDPHGLDIYATYKWGARAMAFDVLNLAISDIHLLGMVFQDREEYNIAQECLIPMTERDRSKCLAMVRTHDHTETPGQSQLIQRGWRDIDSQLTSQGHQSYIDEVYHMLKSDYKCELQSLNHAGPFGLSHYLLSKMDRFFLEK